MRQSLCRKAIFFCTLLLLGTCITFRAEAGTVNTQAQDFLAWYEQNKNTGGDYWLESDLILDSGTKENPIILDGTGPVYLQGDHHGIYIKSRVTIDNPNLNIYSSAEEGAVTVGGKGADEACLSLKNGTITGGETDALRYLSGELICPAGENRFRLITYGDYAGLRSFLPDTYLRNLDVFTDSTENGCGIAGSNLRLENCAIAVQNSWCYPGTATGVQATGGVTLKDTVVEVSSSLAYSIDAPADRMTLEGENTLIPSLDPGPKADDICRITGVTNPTIANIPADVSPEALVLPDTLECTLEYSDGSPAPNREIPVHWRIDALTAQMNRDELPFNGITGEFSADWLAQEHIYGPTFVMPLYELCIIPSEQMHDITLFEFHAEDEPPVIRVQVQRPQGADSLCVEYSTDGEVWTQGYYTNSAGAEREANLLPCTPQDFFPFPQITVSLSFQTEIVSGGFVRMIISGGPFDGIWGPVTVDPEMLGTENEDQGGDEGGGGQGEHDRPGKEDPPGTASKPEEPLIPEETPTPEASPIPEATPTPEEPPVPEEAPIVPPVSTPEDPPMAIAEPSPPKATPTPTPSAKPKQTPTPSPTEAPSSEPAPPVIPAFVVAVPATILLAALGAGIYLLKKRRGKHG